MALVIAPERESMALYLDGSLLADCFLARPLSAIDDVNDWLEAEREYRERRGESGGAEARDQPGL